MKKIFAFVLVLCMMATMAVAENVDFTGDWYLQSLSAEGIELTAAMLGIEMKMTLAPDGTAVLTSDEDVTTGTWALADGVLTVSEESGEVMDFTMNEEGALVFTEESTGATMVFTRELGEEEAFTVPEAALVEDIAAYNGVWTAADIYMMGMLLPVDTMGINMTLDIQDGLVKISDETEDTVEAPAKLVDGQLVFAVEETEELMSEMAMYLSVDGTIVMNIEELGACMIFEQQIAE